ncbi:MAG: FG-GAP-like repeat-containing protein [Planctomycetota bacterium]
MFGSNDRTRGRQLLAGLALVMLVLSGPALLAQPDWVQFVQETGTRLVGPAGVTTSDIAEKDFAWGDVDQDGDIDLVVVRKEDFTSGLTAGPATLYNNVLFLNENGVLTDVTATFVATSDVAGDNGFLTPTNDRDVILADVTGDGWLDIVTCTTLSDGYPKHISHPRIYRNLGMVGGSWAGYIHEDFRMPALAGNTGQGVPHAPRFCSVRAGDIDNDGDQDLYFGDYDSGGSQTLDFNDRLLLNDGSGVFTDGTTSNFTGSIIVGGGAYPFYQSAFGMAVEIEDMNGDGRLDIVKDSALNPPQYVGIAYGSPSTPGLFNAHKEAFPSMAPYHITVGDLNNDNMLDVVVTDDAADSYLLNQGNDANGLVNFTRSFYSFAVGSDDGFGGNSVIADLDNDGFNDVIITDVDVDIGPCNSGRRMHIYHNLGNVPNVTLRQENDGGAWRPAGTHDAAVFDLNGDGWLDMVLGDCTGMEIWINQPPLGVDISFPGGLPSMVPCTDTTTFNVQVVGTGQGVPAANGLQCLVSYDGGAFVNAPVTSLGGDLYEVTLDGNQANDSAQLYFTAQESLGLIETIPSGGASDPFFIPVGDILSEQRENFEAGAAGWTVTNTAVSAGGWELAIPNGTNFAPSEDAGAGTDTFCWVTGNGVPGGTDGAADLDGGPTILTSPVLDLAGQDPTINFDLWFVSNDNITSELDNLVIQATGNGTTWMTVQTVIGNGSSPGWQEVSFRLSDVVAPTATTQIRIVVSDNPNNSVTEAGFDNFVIRSVSCGATGPSFLRGDINGDGSRDISDPIALLQGLFDPGTDIPCESAADANDDGSVNIADPVSILDTLFSGGGPIPAPSSACGTDPTSDGLTCNNGGSCP